MTQQPDAPGLLMPADHWSSGTVHSVRRQEGRSVETWCELTTENGLLTHDLITCSACAESSWKVLR